MNEPLNEKVSVVLMYEVTKGKAYPFKLRWQGTDRYITQVGFHYTKREGRKIVHSFTCTDGNLTYYLLFDSETLHWKLMEVSDGNAS